MDLLSTVGEVTDEGDTDVDVENQVRNWLEQQPPQEQMFPGRRAATQRRRKARNEAGTLDPVAVEGLIPPLAESNA